MGILIVLMGYNSSLESNGSALIFPPSNFAESI